MFVSEQAIHQPQLLARIEETNKIKESLSSSFTSVDLALEQLKQHQKDIENSSTYWKATFDSVDSAIAILNDHSQITRVNKKFLEVVGLPCKDVKGQIVCQIFCEEDQRCPSVETTNPCKNGCFREFVHRNDRIYQIKFSQFIVEDKIDGCLFIASDITNSKITERKLQEAKFLYKNIFNLVKSPILVIDVNSTKIIDVNEAAIDFYGYSASEFMSLCANAISAEPEKTLERLSNKIKHTEIGKHRNKTGTSINVEISASYFTINGDDFCVEIISPL